MKLRGYGEDRLVGELTDDLLRLDRDVKVGPGDDCAVIAQRGSKWDQLLKTDSIVENIHFQPSASAEAVGWKAMCRAISDIAAMGGEPRWGLVTLGLREDLQVAWVKKLWAGVKQAAARYGVEIVGGETVKTLDSVFVTVSLTGRVERGTAVLRSGGKLGDALLVTGRLGGSIAGWHLKFEPRVAEGGWLRKSGTVHSMMDLSDGLGADLPRLTAASGVGYRLYEQAIPLRRGADLLGAINDGEDYELLLSASLAKLPKLLKEWKRNFPQLPLSVIGEMTHVDEQQPIVKGGFHHF